MLAEIGSLLYISLNRVTVKWLRDISVSDAIATKKKAFIHGSPLVRRKKGLGEGKSPHANIPGAALRCLASSGR